MIRAEVPDAAAMEEFGRDLGAGLVAGDLLILSGPLGAGKTTLTRGLGAGLGVRGPVQSPTFVLARTHPSLVGGAPLVHVDAYRLGSAELLEDLDLDFARSVVVVEWGAGLLDDVSASWLEVEIERPQGAAVADAAAGLFGDDTGAAGAPGDPGTRADPGDAEFLGADEPRVITLRGFGPRWAGTAYADAR
ncbi:tRNA (adenosine(37)-N6)-threonylcarbamoyltransferase complex ATPase subunit type 1 TsaE [Agromyces sp. Leaf222]|uniref:tRNA (adenosine(37)-N6)-threonylcarbamoyltransferase complex ATPase subunit type 1 TsaE n=1 Tax=Agromyces sp. Leaf222 TaxID=1735688 RepID=UPI0006F34382|nr:tRNA (adenosine(37)-N6)-threonylcarbamoyltransferase complex ATPase subunit type 1 TsaE [Agromyces sp. Leaf222]KQM84262.1 tRNA threonylcarbamoyladenosine biosynthesis protein TsaE [Agromyces sp. Leaf222]